MSGIYSALGRIGRDAEQRQTQSGTAVAGWPLAVDVGFGDNKQTLWLDCSLFVKRAYRDEKMISLIEERVEAFYHELETRMSRVMAA